MSVPYSGGRVQEDLDCLPAAGGIDMLPRNVGNYQSMLRNIPEERKSGVLMEFNIRCLYLGL